jgi:hypothetical protein
MICAQASGMTCFYEVNAELCMIFYGCIKGFHLFPPATACDEQDMDVLMESGGEQRTTICVSEPRTTNVLITASTVSGLQG